jgi:hypothetical protein
VEDFCLPHGLPAGVDRLARARRARAVAVAAHIKPKSWRRYEGSRARYVAFARAAWPDAAAPEPPYDVEQVADWVGDMLADGVKSAATAVAALNKFHVSAGGAPLRDTPAIQHALVGWQRLKPPPVQKLPFTKAMLDAVYNGMDTANLRGARDYAMLAVAHGGAFRGESELLAMELPLRPVAQGGSVVDVHTKTDRGVWETSARRIPHGRGGLRSPLGALSHYLVLSGHTTGRVFRNVSGGGTHARSNAMPVSRSSLSALVKTWAHNLGFNPSLFASHSLKHGCAADLKAADVPETVGMTVTNHRSVVSYRGYGGRGAGHRAEAAGRVTAAAARQAARMAAAALERDAWAASG